MLSLYGFSLSSAVNVCRRCFSRECGSSCETASFQRCEHFPKVYEVQNMRDEHKLSSTESVKHVGKEQTERNDKKEMTALESDVEPVYC